MKISLIVAMASNRVIGMNNQMPWHLSADLKRFKQITMGSPIIMGRKTYQSIGKPLPGRVNIVISKAQFSQLVSLDWPDGEFHVFDEIDRALSYCAHYQEIFIIGGTSLYQSMLPVADRLYLTQIHQDFAGDTFFPAIDLSQWMETDRADIDNDTNVSFSYSFIRLDRRS